MARAGRPNKIDPKFEDVPHLIKNCANEEVKKILSDTGINSGDSYLRSALILATFYKNNVLLAWLIGNQADLNHQDRNGYSALHFAGQEKNEEAAELLINAGADLDVVDIYGNSPLWTAIFNAKGDLRVVKLYVQKGANIDSINKYQKSPREITKVIAGIDLALLK